MSIIDKRGEEIQNLIQDKLNLVLSKEELIYIYNLGAKKCEIGDFQNALPIFQFLTLYEPFNALYMKAIAGCLQNMEKFQEAFLFYQSAYGADAKNNCDCLFYMGFCALKLQQNDKAQELFTQYLKDNPGQEFEKRAQLFLQGLSKTKT